MQDAIRYFLTQMQQHHLSTSIPPIPVFNNTAKLQLDKFLLVIPKISEVKTIDPKTPVERAVIKILFELYEIFYSTFEGPLYTIYQKEVIPALLEFYNKSNDAQLKPANIHARRIVSSFKDKEHFSYFLSCATKNEYLSHYKRKQRDLANSTQSYNFFR